MSLLVMQGGCRAYYSFYKSIILSFDENCMTVFFTPLKNSVSYFYHRIVG